MSAQPRTIVVGYDGTAAAERALDVAADLAGYGSRLAVVNVISDAESQSRAAGADGPLAGARERLRGRPVAARYLEPVGEPAPALLEVVESVQADLVVVGRRSHDALRRLWPGSVSSKVVRQARCDILVVR